MKNLEDREEEEVWAAHLLQFRFHVLHRHHPNKLLPFAGGAGIKRGGNNGGWSWWVSLLVFLEIHWKKTKAYEAQTQRDAVTREGRRCPHVRPRHNMWLFFLSRLTPTRLLLEPIRTESGRLGPESAVSTDMAVSAETANSSWNSKKKGAKRTVWTKS